MNKLHIDIAPHRVKDVRAYFKWLHQNNQITDDAHGNKIIAMLGVSFQADEPAIFSEPNEEYIEKEIEWYKSQSLNINDIYGDERPPPKAWQYAADEYGIINSNYGRLIFGDEFHNQYDQALNELQRNPHSRRASMIYNRPSIWVEYLNEDGMNDFICTNAVTYYLNTPIEKTYLNAVVQMRSNDVIFGYRNDYAWQKWVLEKLANDLGVKPGYIIWQVQNLHIYERHFNLIGINE